MPQKTTSPIGENRAHHKKERLA
jgi:hypothetical protein